MRPHVVLRSPLPPAEAEEALRAAISDPPPLLLDLLPPPYLDLFAKRGTKWFVGTARDGRIRLRTRYKVGVATGGLRPWIRGRLLPDGEGSRLEGRFEFSTFIRILVALASLVLLGFLWSGLVILAGGVEQFPGSPWWGLFLVVGAVGIAGGGWLALFQDRPPDDGEEVLRRFLALHLRVTPEGLAQGPPAHTAHEKSEVPL